MSLLTEVRWRAKILAKLVLSRLPVSDATWRRVGVFRLGGMRSGDYAVAVLQRALDRAGLREVRGMRLLELGPGDSLFSAVLAHAAGAAGSVHVDVGDFADRDLDSYRRFARSLPARGYEEVDLTGVASFGDLLTRCGARYLTDGLDSLRRLPSGSVDFTWSQSMIEHVRRAELPETARELRRVMAPEGVALHLVDLRDHLSDGLNSLRFSRRVWESDVMAKSGFYTNRMRRSELCNLFEDAGFRVEVVHEARWESLPVPPHRLAGEFRALPDDDLLVRVFAMRLSPR